MSKPKRLLYLIKLLVLTSIGKVKNFAKNAVNAFRFGYSFAIKSRPTLQKRSGKSQVVGLISTGVGVGIMLFLISGVIPSALDTYFNTNTSAWDSSTATIWDIIPLFSLLGIAIGAIAVGLVNLQDIGI